MPSFFHLLTFSPFSCRDERVSVAHKILEKTHTCHLVLLFRNVWPTNVLLVPISVIIISYWNILSYVQQVSQMSLEPVAYSGSPGKCSYTAWVSSGVCCVRVSFNEVHSRFFLFRKRLIVVVGKSYLLLLCSLAYKKRSTFISSVL